MGREIRRVAPKWQHPKDEQGKYIPLNDESYLNASTQWIKDHQLWLTGKHPDMKEYDLTLEKYPFWASWGGYLGQPEEYRPHWEPEEMTWYQLYETVSEGTPLSPALPEKKLLVDWLAINKDFWGHTWTREQAEAMVKDEYAPSMVMQDGKLYTAEESVLL